MDTDSMHRHQTFGHRFLVWQTTEGQQTANLTLKFKADGTMTERNFAVLQGEQPK